MFSKVFSKVSHSETPHSAAIKAASYDPSRMALRVTFKSGSHYEYGCVERETYDGLVAAESKGRFFHNHIRDAYPMIRRS